MAAAQTLVPAPVQALNAEAGAWIVRPITTDKAAFNLGGGFEESLHVQNFLGQGRVSFHCILSSRMSKLLFEFQIFKGQVHFQKHIWNYTLLTRGAE